MNNEKVKEIKEALELNEYYAIEYFSKSGESKIFTFTDLLTLINELESENERLKEYRKNHSKTLARIISENKELKDRIKELEKENRELLKENEGYHGSYRCAIDKIGELSAERYIEVEQFAERLRYKLGDYDTIKDYVMHELIDETLKEFIE